MATGVAQLFIQPRYRYTCPHCNARLPRKHFFDSGPRPCDECGRPISPGENKGMTWAFALGFVLLAANRAIAGDRPWLVGLRLVIAAGFAVLAAFEFRAKNRND